MEAFVLGVHLPPFGKYPEQTIAELGGSAVRGARRDVGFDVPVDEVWVGSAYGGMLVGQRIMREVGAHGMPVYNVENACSSSASAFAMAVDRVRAGLVRSVLVVGVEKLTAFDGGALPLDEEDWEVRQGMTMPAIYAMRAMRYLAETDATVDDLAAIAMKNHNNAARNPRAYWSRYVARSDVDDARMIADPLTLLHCCPSVDGAAAVMVGSADLLTDSPYPPVSIRSSVVRSGRFTNGFRDMTVSELSLRTVADAYEAAGISASHVDLAEVHDAFSIAELMYYESLGLCERGEAASLVRSEVTEIDGAVPVNPSGGLLGRGHPVGATGLAQIVEATLQLQGRAGEVQVAQDARVGVCHCTGGGAWGFDHGACTVTVLRRDA